MKQMTNKELVDIMMNMPKMRIIEAKTFGSGAHLVLRKDDLGKQFVVVESPADETLKKAKKGK